MADLAPDTDIATQQLLLAAATHDLPQLRTLLRSTPPSVQDPDTAYTPLHCAIVALAPDDDDDDNTNSNRPPHEPPHKHEHGHGQQQEMQAATETVRLLLQHGAIWNDVDAKDETPGCIAHRLGLKELYEIMVDAGVRAEMLLNRLDGYEELDDDDHEETGPPVAVVPAPASHENGPTDDGPQPTDASATATATAIASQSSRGQTHGSPYLRSPLTFGRDRILDAEGNAVMMAWETSIMQRSVARLTGQRHGLRVLNVGHGMGIIDQHFQAGAPRAHHIVEAHPAVVARMTEAGWGAKANVVLHPGRWQDVLPRLVQRNVRFDVVYFDTFAEDYHAFRDFFTEWLVALLDARGAWSFFHGLGADRQICYDVYTKVVEMDLLEAGFDTEWETIAVPDEMMQPQGLWDGVKRPYWKSEKYRLPICTFIE
ncbi:MAG: Arginine N-methyltransferase 2 [Phylliscum demangeonii]|nr:MAG: Arginine N-methyltransferase 2 [Phylliscum demangeonii]